MGAKKTEMLLGTRSSPLALCQANWVKDRVEERNPSTTVTLVHIKTTGDKIDTPLFKVGGKGLFVKEIEEALLRGDVDLAVHSAKDLPAVIPEGLALLIFPEREDPRDALITGDGKRFGEIPRGGKIGTGSLRRQAQLLHLRPDLDIVPLRGNLDTRIRKLSALNLDGLILASAGLCRMCWEARVAEYFEPEAMLPAIGQGVLAIEGRRGDERVRRAVAPLNHRPTELALRAERAFLKRLGGGCQVPIAGLAKVQKEKLAMGGLVAATDGQRVVKGAVEGAAEEGESLGEALAEELLAKGAEEILREIYGKES